MLTKAIRLEYLKFRYYKPFWIILGLFALVFFAVGLSIKSLIDWFMEENAEEFNQFLRTGLPLFDFVDIWQNLAYISYLFKYILAFVIIISICIEYSSKTIRQNVIDGLSYREFLISKLSMVVFLTLLAGVLLTLLGLILGFLYSPVKSLDFVFMNFEFVWAYMLEVFVFLCFAMLVATLIRRTGFAIVLFVLYALAIEPIATAVMQYHYELPVWYFPIKSISNLVRLPFPKYILMEVKDYVVIRDVLVTSAWAVFFIFGTFWLMRKRDV